jgi:hypothetical protein
MGGHLSFAYFTSVNWTIAWVPAVPVGYLELVAIGNDGTYDGSLVSTDTTKTNFAFSKHSRLVLRACERCFAFSLTILIWIYCIFKVSFVG